MNHAYLSDLKINDNVDCVYAINFKYSRIEDQVLNPFLSRNGNKYLLLKINDRSTDRLASVYYYYKNINEFDFLRNDSKNKTKYIKINGRCISTINDQYGVKIIANSIIPADSNSGIVFDTSELFPYNEFYEKQILSENGLCFNLSHTSIDEFQEAYAILDVGVNLEYFRIKNSPYDKFQINIKIPDLDEIYNVPAYLTPTLGTLIDGGYKITFTIVEILKSDDDTRKAGIRVRAKAYL